MKVFHTVPHCVWFRASFFLRAVIHSAVDFRAKTQRALKRYWYIVLKTELINIRCYHSGLVRVIHGVISLRWLVGDHLCMDVSMDDLCEIIQEDDPCEMIYHRLSMLDDVRWIISARSSMGDYLSRDHLNGWQITFTDYLSSDDLAEMIHRTSSSMYHLW